MLGFLGEAFLRVVSAVDRRRGIVFAAAAALLLALGLSGVGAGIPVVGPALGLVHEGVVRVLDLPERLFRGATGADRLSREVAELRLRVQARDEAEREAARLRNLLGYAARAGHTVIPARVIRLDLDPLGGEAWIDAGSRRGIRGGEAVVSPEGLVGVVVDVSRTRSAVRLLRNRQGPIGVRDTRSRVIGVAEWLPAEGRHHVGFVPKQEDVAVGDTLVSSGLGGVFPSGLPVGVVTEVSEPDEAPLKDVTFRPFTSFARLEEVFALMPVPADTLGEIALPAPVGDAR